MSKHAARKTEALPTFLDDTTTATEPPVSADPQPEGEFPDNPMESPAPAQDQTAGNLDELAAAADPVAEAPAVEARPELRAQRMPRPKRTNLGTVTTITGCLVMVGSMLGAVWNPLPRVTDKLGASPTLTFVLGAALVGVGRLRRQFHQLQVDSAAASAVAAASLTAVQDAVQRLVDRSCGAEAPGSASGEDLQHVLVALQRQEEKLNNLTKATKMYGKPLMEIAAQTTEVAGIMHQLRTSLDTSGELQRQVQGRLENQLRSVGGIKADLEALTKGLQQLTATVAAAPANLPSLEPLQQHLARVEVAVQAVAQRLEDTEVRKSLLRLETAQEQTHSAVQQLSRQEAVVQLATNLQRQIEGATTRMCEGLAQLRDGNLGGLETGLREVQREVAGVATALAQVQAAVKAGGTRGVAAASAPTPPIAAPSAPTPNPAAGSAGNPTAPASPAPGTDAASAYQTGTRSSSGKNVLGAIAKLKQLKT